MVPGYPPGYMFDSLDGRDPMATETITTSSPTSWDHLAGAHRQARPDEGAGTAVPPHRPQVAVLTCSDARVSPDRLFDLPDGALFVVRVAGASATVEAVASLTYAVKHLGVGTVLVLGHTHCGAGTAAVEEVDDPALEPPAPPPLRPLASDSHALPVSVPTPRAPPHSPATDV